MNYENRIDQGYQSMISRFGLYDSQINACIKIIADADENERESAIRNLTEEYKKECDYYLNFLPRMKEEEIEAFIWNVVMKLDLIRGLLPGSQGAALPELNEQLENYENQMWKKINRYFQV